MRSLMQALTAAVLSAAWVISLTANAQNQTQNQTQNQPQDQSPAISEQTLNATAAALKQVDSIQKNYEQKMATASSPPEKQRITDEATSAATKAIADHGLTVEQYNTVLQVAQNNPTVRGQL